MGDDAGKVVKAVSWIGLSAGLGRLCKRGEGPAVARAMAPDGAVAVDHNAPMIWSPRLSSLTSRAASAPGGLAPAMTAGVLWLAAGLGAGYWALLAWGRSPVTPVSAIAAPPVGSDAGAVARALGAAAPTETPTPVAPSVQYHLLGVADQPGRGGAALIARDGQPPRPYVVGASLEGGLVLQSVERRVARLGASRGGPTTVELSLPLAAETGLVPSPGTPTKLPLPSERVTTTTPMPNASPVRPAMNRPPSAMPPPPVPHPNNGQPQDQMDDQ